MWNKKYIQKIKNMAHILKERNVYLVQKTDKVRYDLHLI